MSKLSVVINTRNEEKNLPRVFASVKGLADEIVVVDMESTDKTVEIAEKNKARVFKHKHTGYVEPARNFAISKTKGDWVLILDADEEIGQELKKTLKKIIDNPSADFYRLPRKNIIFGKWFRNSRWWPDYNIRFFKKGFVVWSEIIHSVPETNGKGYDLDATEANAILHHHYDNVEQYIERLNRYTTEQAKNLAKTGYKFAWTDLIQKPVSEFTSRYFFGEGYKDGIHGLSLASLQAFSELVLYVKVWQLEKFNDKGLELKEVVMVMKSSESELRYWQADALFKQGGGIVQRFKRKFKLP